MDKADLTRKVKDKARQLGFDLVGVTSPDPPTSYSRYLNWLSAQHHGQMAYLATPRARHRRADPRHILPECRSILVLGLRHAKPPPAPPPTAAHPQGRVAAYAWGDDYHEVLPPRLEALVAYIETLVGAPVPNRLYTDTGPLLERDLAQRAGLGWIGKNSMLINPQSGSYYLLAEILLGIELQIDASFPTDHCGTCTRCLDVCPTGCILPDRTLDAHRCLSYLTIELKGPIPHHLRPHLGDWVFGCDLCQTVCPWNQRFAPSQANPVLPPRSNASTVDLNKAIELSPQEFNRKFKNTPLKRAKRRGFLRNVAVALGNLCHPSSLAPLSHALRHDPEPLVRAHAAWALGRIGGTAAEQVLNQAKSSETHPEVLAEIDAAHAHSASSTAGGSGGR